eukprot:scaffold7326_cov39-Prasinocladus_malaysianus.AAC.2
MSEPCTAFKHHLLGFRCTEQSLPLYSDTAAAGQAMRTFCISRSRALASRMLYIRSAFSASEAFRVNSLSRNTMMSISLRMLAVMSRCRANSALSKLRRLSISCMTRDSRGDERMATVTCYQLDTKHPFELEQDAQGPTPGATLSEDSEFRPEATALLPVALTAVGGTSFAPPASNAFYRSNSAARSMERLSMIYRQTSGLPLAHCQLQLETAISLATDVAALSPEWALRVIVVYRRACRGCI